MKILITGGAGFLGSNITKQLLAHDPENQIILFDSFVREGVEENVRQIAHPNVTVIRGDIRSPEDLKKVPKNIEGIIHLAANPGVPWSLESPVFDFNINAGGTLNILEYSRNHGKIPVIYASTNKVYSEEVNEITVQEMKTRYQFCSANYLLGIPETFPLDSQGRHPHSPYGVSKLTGDLYCQEYFHIYGVPTVVNRMSCLYGPYQRGIAEQGWVVWFMVAKVKGLPLTIFGDGKQVRDCLYAQDIARLYVQELDDIDTHKGQVYNVGGGPENTISLLEFIDWLDNQTGPKMQYEFSSWREADHRVYISDIRKIGKYWQPTFDLETGLRTTFEWVEREYGKQ